MQTYCLPILLASAFLLGGCSSPEMSPNSTSHGTGRDVLERYVIRETTARVGCRGRLYSVFSASSASPSEISTLGGSTQPPNSAGRCQRSRRRVAPPHSGWRGRERDDRANRRREGGRQHARRNRRSDLRRRAGGTGLPRVVGQKARWQARRGPHVDSRGEGGGDRPRRGMRAQKGDPTFTTRSTPTSET